jgi:hypothetical protein
LRKPSGFSIAPHSNVVTRRTTRPPEHHLPQLLQSRYLAALLDSPCQTKTLPSLDLLSRPAERLCGSLKHIAQSCIKEYS